MQRKTALAEIAKEFDATIPSSIRIMIVAINRKPLWRRIGEILSNVSASENVGTFRLMESLKDYLQSEKLDPLHAVQKNLDELVGEKYLVVKKNSPPNYFLSPEFAEAIRISKLMDEKLIKPTVEELQKDPKFRTIVNLEQTIRQDLYDALALER